MSEIIQVQIGDIVLFTEKNGGISPAIVQAVLPDNKLSIEILRKGTNSERANVLYSKYLEKEKWSLKGATVKPIDSPPPPPPPAEPPPVEPPPPGPISTGLSAILTTKDANGLAKQYEFKQTDGVRLSDYVTPTFTQSSFRVRHADYNEFPMTVYFRPDVGSDRIEVVVEWGRIFGDANKYARHSDPYTLTIKKDGNIVHEQNIAKHYWLSRWRYQSSPRPIIRNLADLKASNSVLNFSTGVMNGLTMRTRHTPYVPMGFSGMYPDMGSTGERDELGMITEPQAEYLLTGNDVALKTMMAQAEAINTFKIIMREDGSGIPINFDNHPLAHWYDNSFGYADWINTLGGYDNRYELAHQPAAAYIPFMLTDDPYYLEAIQFQAEQICAAQVPGYRGEEKCLFPEGQTRAYAWAIRDILYAAKVSPVSSNPDWFLPKSYYEKILENNRIQFTNRFVNATAASLDFAYYFNSATRVATDYGMWQEEFLASALGLAVIFGYEGYRPLFEWKVKSTIARTNGTSGWVKAYPTPYYIRLGGLKTWREAWDKSREPAGGTSDVFIADPNKLVQFANYEQYTLGTLAIARRLGVPEAQACHEWLQAEAKRIGTWGVYKWSIAP